MANTKEDVDINKMYANESKISKDVFIQKYRIKKDRSRRSGLSLFCAGLHSGTRQVYRNYVTASTRWRDGDSESLPWADWLHIHRPGTRG